MPMTNINDAGIHRSRGPAVPAIQKTRAVR